MRKIHRSRISRGTRDQARATRIEEFSKNKRFGLLNAWYLGLKGGLGRGKKDKKKSKQHY